MRGYEGGTLDVAISGGPESALRAQGGSIVVNSSQSSTFKTNFLAKADGEIGIASGTLGAAIDNGAGGKDIVDTNVIYKDPGNVGQYGSKYANSDITVNGAINLDVTADKAIGLRVMGDGSKISLLAVPGQEESSITTKSTAVRFSYQTDR